MTLLMIDSIAKRFGPLHGLGKSWCSAAPVRSMYGFMRTFPDTGMADINRIAGRFTRVLAFVSASRPLPLPCRRLLTVRHEDGRLQASLEN